MGRRDGSWFFALLNFYNFTINISEGLNKIKGWAGNRINTQGCSEKLLFSYFTGMIKIPLSAHCLIKLKKGNIAVSVG